MMYLMTVLLVLAISVGILLSMTGLATLCDLNIIPDVYKFLNRKKLKREADAQEKKYREECEARDTARKKHLAEQKVKYDAELALARTRDLFAIVVQGDGITGKVVSEPLEAQGKFHEGTGAYEVQTSFKRCKVLAKAVLDGQHYYCRQNNIYIPSKSITAIGIIKVEKKAE